jgi:hypothetical protein
LEELRSPLRNPTTTDHSLFSSHSFVQTTMLLSIQIISIALVLCVASSTADVFLESVTPSSGSFGGGNPITILGSGFEGDAYMGGNQVRHLFPFLCSNVLRRTLGFAVVVWLADYADALLCGVSETGDGGGPTMRRR